MNREVKRAIITGGSTGIGFALAKLLAKRKVSLFLVSSNEENLRGAKDELSKETEVTFLSKDLSDKKSVHSLFEAFEAFNPDLVINCAGIGHLGEINLEMGEKIVEVNVLALVSISLWSIGFWKKKEGFGILMNISSIAPLMKAPYGSTYSASKAFVNTFTKGLAAEKNSKVHVLLALPGLVSTPFHKRAGLDKELSLKNPFVMSKEDAALSIMRQIDTKKSYKIIGLRNLILVCLSKVTPLFLQTFLRKKIVR